MIASWYVCSVEEATTSTARVILEVHGRDGKPDVNRAYALRQHIKADGMLTRVPTPAEYELLGDCVSTAVTAVAPRPSRSAERCLNARHKRDKGWPDPFDVDGMDTAENPEIAAMSEDCDCSSFG